MRTLRYIVSKVKSRKVIAQVLAGKSIPCLSSLRQSALNWRGKDSCSRRMHSVSYTQPSVVPRMLDEHIPAPLVGHHEAVPQSPSNVDHEADLQSYVASATITSELRSLPDVICSRTLLQLQPSHASAHFTHGTLSTPTTIAVRPIVYRSNDGHIWAFYKLGAALSGHDKVVHGGFLATLLDEVMAFASVFLVESRSTATAEMTVSYQKALPTESCIMVRVEPLKHEGRKVWMRGSIEDAVSGQVYTEAKALFIEPRKEAGMTKFA